MGNKQSRAESGFTLVEILAALTIMAIITFSLLPIFPQIITWAKASERQLVSSNLLTKVIEDAQQDGNVKNGILALSPAVCNETFNAYTEVPQTTLDLLPAYEMNGNAYNIKLAICKAPSEVSYDLLRLRVKVLSSDGKELITSHAYIEN